MLRKHLRPGRFILLGAALGLAYALTRPTRSVAEITLFFPSDVSKPELRWSSDELAEGRPEFTRSRRNPRMSVQEFLLKKDTIDSLCRQLEQSESGSRNRLLREGCLLLDQETLKVEPLGEHSLRVSVTSGEPAIAEELCRGLLRCLKVQIQQDLAAKSLEPSSERDRLESQLVFQEKLLFKRLWQEFSQEKPPAGDMDPMARMQLSEYERNLERFSRMIVEDFYRQVDDAVQAPGFAVVEPLTVRRISEGRYQMMFVGAGIGLGLWLLMRPLLGKGPEHSGHKATP